MIWPRTSIGSSLPSWISGQRRPWAASRAVYTTPLIRTRSPVLRNSMSASVSGVVTSLSPSAAVVTLIVRRRRPRWRSRSGSHGGARGGARARRLRRQLRIRPEVAADVDRSSLRRLQLGDDLGLVLRELSGHLGEARLELLVLGLRRQRLRPVERQIEVAT